MARLSSTITFTGRIGDFTAYEMRGYDGIVLRAKGGASKKRIKTAPSFENTRRLNSEFGGRSAATQRIMRMMRHQKLLADYNIAGPLNALLKYVQKPNGNVFGKRHILLSERPHLLQGFSLNRGTSFDTMLRATLQCECNREEQSARIVIPDLIPGLNFIPNSRYPFYSFVIMLGVVPDMFCTEHGYAPSSRLYDNMGPETVETEWTPISKTSSAITCDIKFKSTIPDEKHVLMLTIGIRFGSPESNGTIEQQRRVGAAKVLMVC